MCALNPMTQPDASSARVAWTVPPEGRGCRCLQECCQWNTSCLYAMVQLKWISPNVRVVITLNPAVARRVQEVSHGAHHYR